MNELYDNIGVGYSVRRCTDPGLAKQLYAQLQGATRIVNIGAGTGSYEPDNIELVAVEPSSEMISQRKIGSHPVERSFSESLPFEEDSFSHAMTVLSMHHWDNRGLVFSEINMESLSEGLKKLDDEFASGAWKENNHAILNASSIDVGYRVISANVKHA